MSAKLAKRLLVAPDFDVVPEYVETYGPEVAEICARANYAPDAQQEHVLNTVFAVRADGLSAAFSTAIISCRQNLKTGALKQTSIGWLFVTEEPLVVWSSHEMDTTGEAMRDLSNLILETPFLARRLPLTGNRGIYEGKSEKRIELADGRRIKFKARTVSGGRGLAANKVILDEAFALVPSMTGSLLPTLTAMPDPQVLYASSAGKADSLVLKDIRDRGRAGTSPRAAYLEWYAPKEACEPSGRHACPHPKDERHPDFAGCALNRERLWVKANPTITTGRINLETIAGLRQELSSEEFARESLGWWDDEGVDAWKLVPQADWLRAERPPRKLGKIGPPSLAIAAAPDLSFSALAGAVTDDKGRTWVKVLAHGPGLEWLVPVVDKATEKYEVDVTIDKGGPARSLIKKLEDRGVGVDTVGSDELCDAAAAWFTGLTETHTIRHMGEPELTEAMRGADWRSIGDRRALGRRDGDVSAVEAASLAAHKAVVDPAADPTAMFL